MSWIRRHRGYRATVKRTLATTLARGGYRITKDSAEPSQYPSSLDVAVAALLSEREEIRLVQVGANDGLYNDPIRPLFRRNPDRMQLLLVEPQTSLIPVLRSTYADHPNVTIANCAVGAEGELLLYSIDPAEWSHCQPAYAAQWPIYRAPTGVTSTSREHVLGWLHKYYSGRRPIQDVVVARSVASKSLMTLLKEQDWPESIDVLQVDTEGYDDEVIRHSDIDLTTPALVNYEHMNLSDARRERLESFFRQSGYGLHRGTQDTMAIRTRPY